MRHLSAFVSSAVAIDCMVPGRLGSQGTVDTKA